MAKFWENEDGVHHVGPFGDQFMLCGDAYDGMGEANFVNPAHNGSDFGEMHPTTKRIVTCPRCVMMIKHCKGIRVDNSLAL